MWQENILLIASRKSVQLSLTGAAGIALGSAAGYILAVRKLEMKYRFLADKEIQEAKEYYALRNKTGEFSDPNQLALKYEDINENPGDVVAQLKEVIRGNQYTSGEERKEEKTDDEEVVSIEQALNVFTEAEPPDEFDYEAEIRNRTEEAPYVITHDEFFGNEKDYVQQTLTYYDGDGVLADEKDKPIDDTDGVVGDYNLNRFGYGSKDNNIVYVRNERMELEFEVVRSKNTYTQEVLGYIQHSEQDRRVRKFRSYDD